MSIQYVTGRQNTTFVPTNKQDIINNVETVLLAAGWTTISGHATTNLLMQSAATPQGYAINVRLKDNAGTCVTFSLESTDGVLVGGNSTTVGGAFVNPGTSLTFRIVANKYQAFLWTSPSTVARGFAAFGVPYVPSFLTGVTTRIGWMMGNTDTDSDTTVRMSFRTTLIAALGTNTPSAQQAMLNATLWTNNGATAQQGMIGLASQIAQVTGNTGMGYRWQDNSALLIDPLISWGDTANTVEGKFKGQLWDAVVATDAYTADITASFDSHNWIVLTDNNVGSTNYLRGSLLLVTS
jgi:hypothetical protein